MSLSHDNQKKSPESNRTPVPASFRVVQPDGSQEILAFDTFPIQLGRSLECEIMLSDGNVSRKHARVDLDEDGGLHLSDCNSLNGIHVNGDPVKTTLLRAGDLINIGDSSVEYMGKIDDSTVVLPRSPEPESMDSGVEGILEIIRTIDASEFPGDPETARLNALEEAPIESAQSGEDEPAVGKDAVEKLHRAYSNLLGIMKFVAGIGNEPGVEMVCSEFVAALRQVYPLLESVVIVERDPMDSEGFEVKYQDGPIKGMGPPPISRTILIRIMEQGEALYAVDATRDPRFEKSASIQNRGVRSMMCAPLLTKGKVVGAVYIDNTSQPYCFNFFDLNLLTVFAFFLGNALNVAQAFHERDEKYEQILETSKSEKKDKLRYALRYSQSEEKFRALFEQSSLGAAIINLEKEIIEQVNNGLVKMLGYTADQLAQRPFHDLLLPDDQIQVEKWFASVKIQEEASFKLHLRTIGGETIIALMPCRLVRMEEESVLVAYFIDITDKERAEKETKLQLDRVTALSELSQALMRTMDQQDIFRVLYEKIRQVLPADFFLVALGQEESPELVPEFYAVGSTIGDENAKNIWGTVVKDPEVSEAIARHRMIICDWTVRPFPFFQKLLLGTNGEPLRSAIFIPIASRKSNQGMLCVQSTLPRAYMPSHLEMLRGLVAQTSLALSNAKTLMAYREQEENLQRLNVQILTAQETERGRISRELHDGIGQQLTAMKYLLESIRASARSNDEKKLEACITEARSLATLIIEDLRAISLDLRPTMLDDLGLKPTLEWFTNQFAQRHEIKVDMDCRVQGDNSIAPEVSTTSYRIIQEALANVAKHSEATNVRIALFKKDGKLHLEVDDDGNGFSPTLLHNKQVTQGCSGVLNMKERARVLGGSFSLESSNGQGTQLRVELPL